MDIGVNTETYQFEATSAQRRRALLALLRSNFGEKNTNYLLLNYDQPLLLERLHMQRLERIQRLRQDEGKTLESWRTDFYQRPHMLPTLEKLDLVALLKGLREPHQVAHDVARILGMDPTVAMLKLGLDVDGEPAACPERASFVARMLAPRVECVDGAESAVRAFVRDGGWNK